MATYTSSVFANTLDLGDGSDGALAFIYAGSATVAGATLSAGVYTLTRDIFASSITVQPGVVVKPSGFRIRCQGAIQGLPQFSGFGTQGSQSTPAVISDNGNAGSATTAGAALSAAGTLQRKSFIGAASGTGAGTQGTAATFLSLGGFGGAGGAQGGGSGGGAQGAASVGPTGVQGSIHDLIFANYGVVGFGTGAQTLGAAVFGGGGGAGAEGDGTNKGGYGGSGGGVIYIAAGNITGNIVIEALGGNGGNAAAAAGAQGGGGGGGGGGVLIIATKAGLVQGTNNTGVQLSVAGGTGGAAATTGTGIAGSAGQAGNIYLFSPENF